MTMRMIHELAILAILKESLVVVFGSKKLYETFHARKECKDDEVDKPLKQQMCDTKEVDSSNVPLRGQGLLFQAKEELQVL